MVREGVLGGNEDFLAWFQARLREDESGAVREDFAMAFRKRAAGAK